MGRRQGEVFMIIRNRFFVGLSGVVLVLLMQASACNPDLTDDPIPYFSFGTVYLNLNLPEYARLKTDGGSIYYDDGGVKGLIVYRQNATTFHVYERNCSYRPNEACATVNIHVSTLFMEDPCCGSQFDFLTGNTTSGVAWRPLRKYFSAANGNDLTITDEILQ